MLITTDGIKNVQLEIIRKHGKAVVEACPIEAFGETTPKGSLFEGEVLDGTVSSIDPRFFVDHREPLQVLEKCKARAEWPLGALLDGYEFFLIVKAKEESSHSTQETSQLGLVAEKTEHSLH